MIRIDRARVRPPDDLTGPTSKGFLEKQDAINYYTGPGYDGKTSYARFAAYRLPGVKQALEELFHGKCAYCESQYVGTQPMAVEHYRPKAAVVIGQKQKKPGYYWLAADWENLLPSCTDCNSARGQEIPGEDFQVVGKANQFPVADESKRWASHTDTNLEEPLLLNPCADDPEPHLQFLRNGDVRPALSRNRRPDPKGRATIAVCGLRRSGLRALRRDHAVFILAQIKRVREALVDRAGAPDKARVESRLRREWKLLEDYRAPEKKYAGMARQLVNPALPVLAQLKRVVEALEDFNQSPGDARRQAKLRTELGRLKGFCAPDRADAEAARQLISPFLREIGVRNT